MSQLRQTAKVVTGGDEVWKLRGPGMGKVISKDTGPSENHDWSEMELSELAVMAVSRWPPGLSQGRVASAAV